MSAPNVPVRVAVVWLVGGIVALAIAIPVKLGTRTTMVADLCAVAILLVVSQLLRRKYRSRRIGRPGAA